MMFEHFFRDTFMPNPQLFAEYAETFFGAEELRLRQAFQSKITNQFSQIAHPVLLSQRICQAGIPDLGDVSLFAFGGNAAGQMGLRTAFRYPDHSNAYQNLSSEQTSLLQGILHEMSKERSAISQTRFLEKEELARLQGALPFSIHAGVELTCGLGSEFFGKLFFLLTDPNEAYSAFRLELLDDLAFQAERAWARAQYVESLKREVASREKLISVASHELKTPITALRLQLDLMKRKLLKNEGRFDSMEKMEETFLLMDRTINRVSQSVGMLFNLSELQSGHITILKEPGNLTLLIGDICGRMEGLMKSSGCRLESELAAGVEGFFDPRRIEQAIVNLLANAAKHAPRSRVRISLRVEEGRAKISVQDEGPGVPKEAHARIFEAFRRLNDQMKVEGLGLGLFITRGVIQAHGGTLSLESAPGEGAKFSLEFPLWQV